MPVYVSDWHKIKYLEPFYSANGANHTRIGIVGNPPHEEPRRVMTVLENLGEEFSCDLGALREKTARVLDRSNNLPLVIHPKLVLLPVRMRQAQAKKDGATGFIVLDKIRHIAPASKGGRAAGTIIKFNDGSTLHLLQQPKSIYCLQGEAVQMLREVSPLYPGIEILPGMSLSSSLPFCVSAAPLNAAAGARAGENAGASTNASIGTGAGADASAGAGSSAGKNPARRVQIAISIIQEIDSSDAGAAEIARLIETAQNSGKAIAQILKPAEAKSSKQGKQGK